MKELTTIENNEIERDKVSLNLKINRNFLSLNGRFSNLFHLESKHLKSQASLHQKIADDLSWRRENHSRSLSRKSRKHDKHKTVYSTQSESPQVSPNKDQSYQLDHSQYYRCMSPQYPKPPVPVEIYGPPVHEEVEIFEHGVDPHGVPPPEVLVPTEVVHEMSPPLPPPPMVTGIIERHGSMEKEKKIVTTLDRSMKYSPGKPYKARATSPLKSCIQNAEVKVARGGVAISFDPWKADKNMNKVKFYFP